jgi:hypothetical protein
MGQSFGLHNGRLATRIRPVLSLGSPVVMVMMVVVMVMHGRGKRRSGEDQD